MMRFNVRRDEDGKAVLQEDNEIRCALCGRGKAEHDDELCAMEREWLVNSYRELYRDEPWRLE